MDACDVMIDGSRAGAGKGRGQGAYFKNGLSHAVPLPLLLYRSRVYTIQVNRTNSLIV